MAKKSTTAKPKVVNESKLVLPQDIGGFTVNFRREAARSVGRIMADGQKLEVFLELLDVFKQYAIDRFEHQEVVMQRALADKAEKLRKAQEQALRDADSVVASKRATVAHLQKQIDAHDAKMQKLEKPE